MQKKVFSQTLYTFNSFNLFYELEKYQFICGRVKPNTMTTEPDHIRLTLPHPSPLASA